MSGERAGRRRVLGDKRLMVFPFTVALDGAGNMRDPAQGIYARSLARTLAERLSLGNGLQASAATLTANGPPDGEQQKAAADAGQNGWVVTSQPWSLPEACEVELPEGTEYLLHGAAELTDRVRLRLMLVDQPQKRLALDHVVLRPRSELFPALEEATSAVASALGQSPPELGWPTEDVEAFVAYLRGRDMTAAHEAGVHVQDPSRSFDGYLEAARRDPRFEEARDRLLSMALDFALGGQGPAQAGRDACRRLLEQDPGAFKAHAALAEIELAEGRPLQALQELQKVLEQKADWWPAYERVGTALLRLQRPGEARPWFERALREKPDDPDALHGLGVCLAEQGELEKAVETWKQTLAAGHHPLLVHQNLAEALLRLGRRAEARVHQAEVRRLSGKPSGPWGFLREVAGRLRTALGGA